MKKTFIIFAALFLSVTGIAAQNNDIEKFWKELKALEGNEVECEAYDAGSYVMEQFMSQLVRQLGEEAAEELLEDFPQIGKGQRLLVLETDGEEGYRRVCSIVEKYEIDTAEELFGIPLMINNRDEGEQQIIFSNDDYTLIFNDEPEDSFYEISIASCNIIDLLQKTMLGVMEGLDGDSYDISVGDGYISYSYSVNGDENNNDNEEKPCTTVADNMIKKPAAGNVGLCYDNEILEPSLLLNDNGEYIVAIPALTDEDKRICCPYAVNGIYDWINETGFGKGGGENPHQRSEIVTPSRVVKEYFRVKNAPTLSIEHPSEGMRKHLAAEYQGGTPAVLYRKSLTPEGYRDAMSDFAPFFALENGDRFKNLKVVNRYDSPDGTRFVQLYGDSCVLVCLYDSPAEECCSMSITVGDNDAFASAVNSYRANGEGDLARKCRITVGDNGIGFSNGNLMNPRGVFFELDYYNRINHK